MVPSGLNSVLKAGERMVVDVAKRSDDFNKTVKLLWTKISFPSTPAK